MSATNKAGFQLRLSGLLNEYSAESPSDTPDYILATYLTQCLRAYNEAVVARREWHEEGNDPL